MEKTGLETIIEMMPEGWKEAAKTTKALTRSRNIKTPEELLRLNLLYQTNGGSYGLTSAIMQIAEEQKSMNKNAVYKRIVNSAGWLKWLCENMCRQEGFLVTPPEWLKSYRVCMVDASDYSKPGSCQADMRFHCMTELFTLNAVEMYFTDASEGERMNRYEKIQEKDLIIADRAYGTLTSISHIKSHGADFLLRLRTNSFKLYTKNGENLEEFNLAEVLTEWKPGRILDYSLYCKIKNEVIPVRICAIGKTETDVAKSQQQLEKTNKRKQRGAVSSRQKIFSRYVVIATSLPTEICAEKILLLYRMRWQIELVFKRFKSIFNGREFALKTEESIKAWFYGKLLLAIICETLVKRGRFSPEQEISV